MYEKNIVIRKKIIFLSGSAKFSFAYPQFAHLHIRNILICISAILQVGYQVSDMSGIMYLTSQVPCI